MHKLLIGADIPANSYTVGPIEWADGSRSGVVYTSQTKSLPPILIETQYNIDQTFILRLINYSSNAFYRYKMLPIVLVNATKSISSAAFKTEFTPSECELFLETSCKFWAKRCVVMTQEAVFNHLHKPAFKSCAQETILSIKQLERELQDASEEEESKQAIFYIEEDAQSIESTCEPGKNKNWKYIFNKGKAEGFFESYKSFDSLKSFVSSH